MITDATELQDARDAWEFVRHTRNVIVGNCNKAIGLMNQKSIRDLCFNLLLASAFSVLEKVLLQLRDESKFSSKDNRLKSLMRNSRPGLKWQDWVLIDTGRDERNKSVHERTYLDHAKCRDYIAAIELELVAWGVLTSATPKLWHW